MAFACVEKAGSLSSAAARTTPELAAFKQHFLYFLPLPHGHGSFRPVFILIIIAELCRVRYAANRRLEIDFVLSEKSRIGRAREAIAYWFKFQSDHSLTWREPRLRVVLRRLAEQLSVLSSPKTGRPMSVMRMKQNWE